MPGAMRSPDGLQAALYYPAHLLAPNEKLVQQFNIYAGPKEYRKLAEISSAFDNNIDLAMGFGYFGFLPRRSCWR